MVDIPNDNTTTAVFEGSPLSGASFSGELEDFNDNDWIKVSLVAGTTYKFYANAASAGSFGDSYLKLYDAAGVGLTLNDDGGVGLNSIMSFTAATTGTYFVEVHDAKG
ncbi:MAG: PPC domain-containing protein, partial [Bradyrhizobium sp.]